MSSHEPARRDVLIDDLTHAVSGWPRRCILLALARRTMCAKELCTLLGFDKVAASRNLSILRKCELVNYEQHGTRKDFHLTDNVEVGPDWDPVTLIVRNHKGEGVEAEFPLDPDIAVKFDQLQCLAV